jgi:hypothetical protein
MPRVRVSNKDRSPARIHSCNTAPDPTGFAEVVSDDFPVLHARRSVRLLIFLRHLRCRFAHFSLGAHLLDLRGLLFELRRENFHPFLLLGDR